MCRARRLPTAVISLSRLHPEYRAFDRAAAGERETLEDRKVRRAVPWIAQRGGRSSLREKLLGPAVPHSSSRHSLPVDCGPTWAV